MDLDNLKKDWQATNPDVRVDDDKIRQMLDNKGKSAFEKLLKVEWLSFKAGIACILLAVLFYFTISPGVGISYTVFLGFSMIWQMRMIKILQGIDVSQMDVMSVSEAFNKYKKRLVQSIIWGSVISVIWLLYACFTFVYKVYLRDNLDTGSVIVLTSVMLVISFGYAVAFVYFIYSRYYFKNIREIERSIKEVKEYQKDNLN